MTVFVEVDDAIGILREEGLDLKRRRLYALASEGALPAGEVVLREGRKVLFRVDGLREWVRRGGSVPRRDTLVAA